MCHKRISCNRCIRSQRHKIAVICLESEQKDNIESSLSGSWRITTQKSKLHSEENSVSVLKLINVITPKEQSCTPRNGLAKTSLRRCQTSTQVQWLHSPIIVYEHCEYPSKIEKFDFWPLTVGIVLISKWNMIVQINIYHIPQKCIFMIFKYKIMFIFRWKCACNKYYVRLKAVPNSSHHGPV